MLSIFEPSRGGKHGELGGSSSIRITAQPLITISGYFIHQQKWLRVQEMRKAATSLSSDVERRPCSAMTDLHRYASETRRHGKQLTQHCPHPRHMDQSAGLRSLSTGTSEGDSAPNARQEQGSRTIQKTRRWRLTRT